MDYLNRVKKFKANCILVFKIREQTHANQDQQRDIDRFHIQRILSDLDLEHLQEDHVWNDRLGRKDGSKIRPIRIQFGNNCVRERIIRRAWMLKFSIRYSGTEYPDGVFLSRDLTKEDRETEKENYLQRKQQNNAAGRNPGIAAPDTTLTATNDEVQENSSAALAGDRTHPHGVGETEVT